MFIQFGQTVRAQVVAEWVVCAAYWVGLQAKE
jgi:hypothetical protein